MMGDPKLAGSLLQRVLAVPLLVRAPDVGPAIVYVRQFTQKHIATHTHFFLEKYDLSFPSKDLAYNAQNQTSHQVYYQGRIHT